MMQNKRWTLWSFICLFGIPWLIIFIISGILLKSWYISNYKPYSEFMINGYEDIKDIITYSIFGWLFVVLRNMVYIQTDKKIGLFTWLEKYKYEPPQESTRKRKAQHPPIDEEYLSNNPDGLVLGRSGKKYVRFPIKKGHALSTIILGTPGSGKSTLLLTTLIYQLQILRINNKNKNCISEEQVFFVLDAKPELYRKSSFPGDKHIKELSIVNRSKFGWDPYYNLKPDASDDEILTELDVIANAFIESPKEKKNEFFYESARTIFEFMSLAEFRNGRSFMQTIDKLMSADMANMIKTLLDSAEGRPELIKVKKGLNAYANKEGEAFQGIELAFRQSMKAFQKDSTKFFLDGNPKKLSPLTLEEKISIAFTIKTTQIKEYKIILRLVIMQLLRHCEERDEDDSHLITLIIDEAFRLGVINWIEFLSVCRSKQVSCVLAFQSLSQMQSVWSKEDADSLLEMVSAIAVLSCASTTTAKMICDWAGEYNEEKISTNNGGKNNGTYSRSYEPKKILQPSDIMKLRKLKEVILFLDGMYYRANLERAKYYNIPELNKISKRCVEEHKQTI